MKNVFQSGRRKIGKILFILMQTFQEFLLLSRKRLFLLAFILRKCSFFLELSRRVKGKAFVKKLSASTDSMFILQEVQLLSIFFERQPQECTVDLKNRGRSKKFTQRTKNHVISDMKCYLQYRSSFISTLLIIFFLFQVMVVANNNE